MKKINIHNYEAFLLDLMEGSLSPAEKQELMDFLAVHPEFQVDMEGRLPVLQTDDVVFDRKDALLRNGITPENRGYYFIAFRENQLQEREKEEVSSFLIQHPDYQKEFEQYQKAVVNPEEIVFPHKSKLLKPIWKTPSVWAYAAAASVAILFGASYLFQTAEYSPRLGGSMITAKVITEEEPLVVQPYPVFSDDVIQKNKAVSAKQVVVMNSQQKKVLPQESPQNTVRQISPKKAMPINQLVANAIVKAPEKTQDISSVDLMTSGAHRKEVLTLPEYIAYKVREKISKDEPVTDPKVRSTDLGNALVYAYERATGKESLLAKEETAGTRTIAFRLGSLEYKRIIAKN